MCCLLKGFFVFLWKQWVRDRCKIGRSAIQNLSVVTHLTCLQDNASVLCMWSPVIYALMLFIEYQRKIRVSFVLVSFWVIVSTNKHFRQVLQLSQNKVRCRFLQHNFCSECKQQTHRLPPPAFWTSVIRNFNFCVLEMNQVLQVSRIAPSCRAAFRHCFFSEFLLLKRRKTPKRDVCHWGGTNVGVDSWKDATDLKSVKDANQKALYKFDRNIFSLKHSWLNSAQTRSQLVLVRHCMKSQLFVS